jgi:glutamyl-Q tRNA(Asp) synthetase
MAFAKKHDGQVLLRFDDVDQTRCSPAYETAILDDLSWCGLNFTPPYRRQSEHLADYQQALIRLADQGLVYQADRSRKQIAEAVAVQDKAGKPWPRDPDGAPHYPFTKEDRKKTGLAGNIPLRLNMEKALELTGQPLFWEEEGQGRVEAKPELWGDIILARRDCPVSYHLATVVDDAAQGITHVVRGRDLFHATGIQRLLQALLDIAPPRYVHHSLILDNAGEKLSKSKGSHSLRAYRAEGWAVAKVYKTMLDMCETPQSAEFFKSILPVQL